MSRKGLEAEKRYNAVRSHKAERVPITTTLEQAIKAAGLAGEVSREESSDDRL